MDPEIERRNAEVEARGREIERAFAELEKRSAPKAAEAPPAPAQKISYESDHAKDHIYSPAPDFMKPSSQAAIDYARMQRDQKLFMDIAIERAEKVGPKSADAAKFSKLVMDTQKRAGIEGQFQPLPGQQVEFTADGTRVMRPAAPPVDVRDALPRTLPVPGVGPEYIPKDVVVMHDPDSGRGVGANVSLTGPSEVAELKAQIAGLQYQVTQLIQRLP